jgi:hypothetical protein
MKAASFCFLSVCSWPLIGSAAALLFVLALVALAVAVKQRNGPDRQLLAAAFAAVAVVAAALLVEERRIEVYRAQLANSQNKQSQPMSEQPPQKPTKSTE